ncbi:uncharacterized protein DEA37_0010370 [Paragonimus westermani]|uniref:G protein gamma domain-containing protein n=1 Tax=Paragonimus westermani TaxID=34504 RepID=A0A5J4NWG7_9TREM|nr:uncharacterized protein DEA37_0010370 [Paragonimus westermani]
MGPVNVLIDLENKRREVYDFRIHYSCERQRLSHTLKDLIDFCQQMSTSDPLLHRGDSKTGVNARSPKKHTLPTRCYSTETAGVVPCWNLEDMFQKDKGYPTPASVLSVSCLPICVYVRTSKVASVAGKCIAGPPTPGKTQSAERPLKGAILSQLYTLLRLPPVTVVIKTITGPNVSPSVSPMMPRLDLVVKLEWES